MSPDFANFNMQTNCSTLMKKINLLLFFSAITGLAYSQGNNYDLPPEFKDVAVQAFAKLGPATKQWFITTASQHPAGSFDTAWTKKKLREKFGIGLGGADPSMDLFVVMMAYQKMMNKEAREDKKMQTQDKRLELAGKESKLKMENTKIDQQKKEADEKADNAMVAAQTEMWIGIVSGNTVIASGISSQQSNQKTSSTRLSPAVSQKPDSIKPVVNNVSVMQKQADQQEKKISEDKEATKAGEDRKKAMKDAVKKLLDQMAQMKTNLNP